jgi:hypothetical protein
MDNEELITRFPWLGFLSEVAKNIVETLMEKERHYEGSWQKRGGVGAFMMMCRKWDRIESITARQGYDIFAAQESNDGDIGDDLDDLIGYLLLIRAEHRRRVAEGDMKISASKAIR